MDLLGLSMAMLKGERCFEISEAEAFGVQPEPESINFGVIDPDKPATATLHLVGAGSAVTEIEIVSPQKRGQPYTVSADKVSVKVSPEKTISVMLQMTLRCTTNVFAPIALHRSGAGGYMLVPLRAEGAPSTKLDFNELKFNEKVGEGSYGRVYSGTWRETVVAIKEIKIPIESDYCSEVMREVDLMSRLRSPFIVTFIGSSVGNERLHIITEFMPLGNLASLLKRCPGMFTRKLEVKFALDCAQGMSYLHANGCMHRDLKPENLLVTSMALADGPNAKLTDFGTSKMVKADEVSPKHTKGIGTSLYIAPEIMNGDAYGASADVFSFAVLMWELHAHHRPYLAKESEVAIMTSVLRGEREAIPPDVPMADLISRCWVADPAARPPFSKLVPELETLFTSTK
jgi:hypothetical protein